MTAIHIRATRHSAFYSPLLATVRGGFLEEEGLEPGYAQLGPGETAGSVFRDGTAHLCQSAVAASWRALEAGRWSNRLLEAAFARSDEMQGISLEDARTQDLLGSGVLPDIVEDPWAWIIERNDGLQTTLLLMNGAAGDFLFAAKLKAQEGIVSTQMLRSPGPNVHYSACLASNIQKMFETGRPPYPVERTLLVSGILDRAFDSLAGGSVRLETPELDVRYTVGPEPRHAHA